MQRQDQTLRCDERPAREGSDEQWYWVKASYKAVHLGVVRRRHLWQTIVFLICGPSTDEISPPAVVRAKAEEVAKRKEHQYETSAGDTVRWVLQRVDMVLALLEDEIGEGTEVYWEFYHKVDKAPPQSGNGDSIPLGVTICGDA